MHGSRSEFPADFQVVQARQPCKTSELLAEWTRAWIPVKTRTRRKSGSNPLTRLRRVQI